MSAEQLRAREAFEKLVDELVGAVACNGSLSALAATLIKEAWNARADSGEAVAWRCRSTAIGAEWFYREGPTQPYETQLGMVQEALFTHLIATSVDVRDVFYDVMQRVLRSHRLQFAHDEDGEPYPLIDAMSLGSPDVSTGIEEITLMCDAVYNELPAAIASREG